MKNNLYQKVSFSGHFPSKKKKNKSTKESPKRLTLPKKRKNCLPQKPLNTSLYRFMERNPYQTNFRRNLYQRIFELLVFILTATKACTRSQTLKSLYGVRRNPFWHSELEPTTAVDQSSTSKCQDDSLTLVEKEKGVKLAQPPVQAVQTSKVRTPRDCRRY